MYFKPPQNNMTSPFYHPLNRQPVQEAVTVEMEFKTDADGATAVGSETGRRGLLIGGKKVKDKVYKLTFTNNAMMNKFMDKYENKLNEGTEELEEGTPAYRKMMQKYKGSDMEKVFKMLRDEGYKVGEQDDTLVRNLLKKHRGNVKKVVDQIVKDYPGKFDINRMMMDHVEIDEEKKLDSRGLGVTRQSGLGSKKVNGEKAREILTSAKIPHSMVMGTIRVPARFVSIAKKKLDNAFGGMFQKKTGFKISGTMKEDVEQVDEVKATARNIVRGLSDSDGPFTVVAMKRDKVIKQESTKMRNMLPAIIGEMRKEVGSGVTIAIEDKRGTIRNTFKEGVGRVIDNLDDYLAEGSE